VSAVVLINSFLVDLNWRCSG